MKAIVVFHDEGRSSHWLDNFLEPGFKHCFVTLLKDDYWVLLDPTICGTDIQVVADSTVNVAHSYRMNGYKVKEITYDNLPPKYPYIISNCVGIVKAVIGINNPMVMTPYQLWNYL